MDNLTLIRSASDDTGTFGQLSGYFTGELPWFNNDPDTSCIPAGEYEVLWKDHPKHGFCYELQNVPNRSTILIHSGNFCGNTTKGFQSDVLGCILLGKGKGPIQNKFGNMQMGVSGSKDAVQEFQAKMQQKPFVLKIQTL